MTSSESLTFRWMGVNGIELVFRERILLIDPFFTRPGLIHILLNRAVKSDAALVRRYISKADWVFVTHSHYDHLMDVPNVLKQTGARGYGSANTCQILALNDIADRQIIPIHVGDHLEPGPFKVEVMPCWHTPTPLGDRIKGPLRDGLSPPLRLNDYKMDEDFSFLLDINGQHYLIGNQPVQDVEVLFLSPYLPNTRLVSLLQTTNPRKIVATHWEDFTRPVSARLHPLPFKVKLKEFQNVVRQISPQTEVLIPELMKKYII